MRDLEVTAWVVHESVDFDKFDKNDLKVFKTITAYGTYWLGVDMPYYHTTDWSLSPV